MVNRLFKTRLRQVSLIGGLMLLVGALVGTTLAFHTDTTAAQAGSQYLKGPYMVTFQFQDEPQQFPCQFTADTSSPQAKGGITCTHVHTTIESLKAIQTPTVHGMWEKDADNRYFIGVVRTYFSQEDFGFAGQLVASGVFTRDGDTLSGRLNAKRENANGNVIERFPVPSKLRPMERTDLEVAPPNSE